MGDDWKGKFDSFRDECEVVYLPRTIGVSSSALKAILGMPLDLQFEEMKKALEIITTAIEPFQDL